MGVFVKDLKPSYQSDNVSLGDARSPLYNPLIKKSGKKWVIE
jgi:hypothetical protein